MKYPILFILLLTLISCKHSVKKTSAKTNKIIVEPSYSKQNNLLGEVVGYSETQFLNADTTVISEGNTMVYVLDETKNLIEEQHLDHESGGYITLTRYFDINGVQYCTTYNHDGAQINFMKILKSFKHNKIVKQRYDERNILLSSTIIAVDNKQNIVSKTEISSYEPRIKEREIYVYDKNNNCIEKYGYNLNVSDKRPTIKITYLYDKFGNCIQENHHSIEAKDSVYDPNYRWKYTYDKNGNWLKKFDYSGNNKEPYMREERTYVYQKYHIK